jgi:hypothetical protein
MDATLERRIDTLQGRLVETARRLVKDTHLGEYANFDTQLRNVVDAAASVECPQVIANFVRYQMARQWKDDIPRAFGRAFLEELEAQNEKEQACKSELHAALKDSGCAPAEEDGTLVSLARSLLGYINREYKFADKILFPKGQGKPGKEQPHQAKRG